jgi:hypothetical protein
MGLWPSPHGTRVVALGPESETILRATLSSRPSSIRAVTTFFEALALWEGRAVRAVLVADASSTSQCPTTLYRDTFATFGDRSQRYELAWVSPPRARHRDVETMGSFLALERILLRTVAR